VNKSTPKAVSLEELQERVQRCPYHHWLGMQAESIDPNGMTMRITLRPEMMSNPVTRAVHGGIYAALIDSTTSCAILARYPGNNLTIDLRVDYHRPVVIEPDKVTHIRAIGTVVRVGRTVGTADARVIDSEGNLLASGRGVFMRENKSSRAAADPHRGGDPGS
jgi:uncharacterized protein (TIGR00369 family)